MNWFKKLTCSALILPALLIVTSTSFCAQQSAESDTQNDGSQLMLNNLQTSLNFYVSELDKGLKGAIITRYSSSNKSIASNLDKAIKSLSHLNEFFSASLKFNGFLAKTGTYVLQKLQAIKKESNSERQLVLLLQVLEMTDSFFQVLHEKSKSANLQHYVLASKTNIPFWNDISNFTDDTAWKQKINVNYEQWTQKERDSFDHAFKATLDARLDGIDKRLSILEGDFNLGFKNLINDFSPTPTSLIKECRGLYNDLKKYDPWYWANPWDALFCLPRPMDEICFSHITRREDNDRIKKIETNLLKKLETLELYHTQCTLKKDIIANTTLSKNDLEFHRLLHQTIHTNEVSSATADGWIRKAIELRKTPLAQGAAWASQKALDVAVQLGFRDKINNFILNKAQLTAQNNNSAGMEIVARFFLGTAISPDRCGLTELLNQVNTLVDQLPPSLIKSLQIADCDGKEKERIHELRAGIGQLIDSTKKMANNQIKTIENACVTIDGWSSKHIQVAREIVKTLEKEDIELIGTALLYRDSWVATTGAEALSLLARNNFGQALLSKINEPMAILLARLTDRGLPPDRLIALANKILDNSLGHEFINVLGSMAAETPDATKQNLKDLLGLLSKAGATGEILIRKGAKKIIDTLMVANTYIKQGEWSAACWLCTSSEYTDLCLKIAQAHKNIPNKDPKDATQTAVLPRCKTKIANAALTKALSEWNNVVDQHYKVSGDSSSLSSHAKLFINCRRASIIINKLKEQKLAKEREITNLKPLKNQATRILWEHNRLSKSLTKIRQKYQVLNSSWRWWDNLWLPSWISFWKESSRLARREQAVQSRMFTITRPMPGFEQTARRSQNHYTTLLRQQRSIQNMYNNWFNHLNLLKKQNPYQI
ncbi:TPA: hypothetical protein DDZ86_02655 [Candidatus Dependentiae bacterium]|nr:MAG: hypothetical protein UW09_C0001G0118 [candidate division TM6 bacterium GW2011_GWF2_43_87]HBL98519.1 hypothetical protein [Candidatus Dependentiae bacterium]